MTSDIVHIVDSEFDLKADLHYGSVEGIYLSMSIEGYFSNDPYHEVKEFVMVFKTLRTDDDAMYKMASLQASCMIACKKHLEEHASDYERRGYLHESWSDQHSLRNQKQSIVLPGSRV